MSELNNQLILISGASATGKSASLRNIRDQDKWIYVGCEAGKALPFKNNFQDANLEDPKQLKQLFEITRDEPECKGIIIDTLTFLMDMFESQYVLDTPNTRQGWLEYQQYFKRLMQEWVLQCKKPTIILAHTQKITDDKTLETVTQVPIKGGIKGNGVEAYFTTVVSTKKVSLKDLEPYKNDMLHITEDEEILGFKYCFQTMLTKETIGERIRSPMGMFSRNQTYIDNDVQVLLDYIDNYYNN